MNKNNRLLLLFLILCIIQNIIATTTTTTTTTTETTTITEGYNISLISWIFIKISNIISSMISISQLPMLPFIWITQWLFQQLVITPYHMAVETTNILYPIFIYCAAACLTGAIIGSVSGFATEAIVIMFMNATWGKDEVNKYREKKRRNKNKKEEFSRENENNHHHHHHEQLEKEEEEEDEDYHHDWNQPAIQSPTSSLYRFSISSDTSSIHPLPTSFYDDKPDHWFGNDDDPEEIASFLRQRRKLQQQ